MCSLQNLGYLNDFDGISFWVLTYISHTESYMDSVCVCVCDIVIQRRNNVMKLKWLERTYHIAFPEKVLKWHSTNGL